MNKFLLTAAMMLLTLGVQAQVKVAEPEFIGQVAMLTSDSTSVLLTKEKSTMKTSTSKLGFLPIPGAGLLDKSKTKMVLQGNSAHNTFKSGDIRFLLRVEKQELDPTTYLRIVKFDVKKKTRESVIAQMGLIQGFSFDMNSSEHFEVKKYGDNSLLVTLKGLEPGQYGITFTGLMEASTFGIE